MSNNFFQNAPTPITPATQPAPQHPVPQAVTQHAAAVAGQPAQQAPANLDHLANLIGGAVPSKQGVYFTEGSYPLLYVDAIRMVKSQKSGADLYTVEFTILQSQVPERPAGMQCTWQANLTHHQPAPGNVRDFLAKLQNKDLEQVGAEDFARSVSPQNPFAGRLIGLQTQDIKTQRGNAFTKHIYFAVAETYQTESAKIRSQILGQQQG